MSGDARRASGLDGCVRRCCPVFVCLCVLVTSLQFVHERVHEFLHGSFGLIDVEREGVDGREPIGGQRLRGRRRGGGGGCVVALGGQGGCGAGDAQGDAGRLQGQLGQLLRRGVGCCFLRGGERIVAGGAAQHGWCVGRRGGARLSEQRGHRGGARERERARVWRTAAAAGQAIGLFASPALVPAPSSFPRRRVLPLLPQVSPPATRATHSLLEPLSGPPRRRPPTLSPQARQDDAPRNRRVCATPPAARARRVRPRWNDEQSRCDRRYPRTRCAPAAQLGASSDSTATREGLKTRRGSRRGGPGVRVVTMAATRELGTHSDLMLRWREAVTTDAAIGWGRARR